MKKLLAIILFLTMFIPSMVSSDLTSSLQGYWKLEEASGSRADETANSNDLTDNNTVLQGTGIIGNAADFENDTSEWLEINDGDQTGLEFTGDFTLSGWVKPEVAVGFDMQWALFGKLAHGAGNGYLVFWGKPSGTFKLRTVVSNGGFGTIDFNHELVTNAFTHIVFRFTDSTKEHSLWINGVESTGTGSKVLPASWDSSFEIGAGGHNDGNNWFDGLIDEVGIWDRALTDDEIGELYNGGDGLTYPFIAVAARRTINTQFIE